MLSIEVPSFNVASSLVVLPTSWKANEIVPFLAFMSLMVSGILSPFTP